MFDDESHLKWGSENNSEQAAVEWNVDTRHRNSKAGKSGQPINSDTRSSCGFLGAYKLEHPVVEKYHEQCRSTANEHISVVELNHVETSETETTATSSELGIDLEKKTEDQAILLWSLTVGRLEDRPL
jgi:hypothetical protein